jgi:phosphoglycolate phosphatase
MKAFIFDLDGTLIDSLDDLADAVNLMLGQHGYPLQPREVFPQYIGDGVHKLVERALPESARDAETIAVCTADYQRHYEATWNVKTKPYHGILETLTALRESGMKLAVLSNKPHRFTLLCCEHFFAEGTFDMVLGQRSNVPRKPDPAGVIEIAETLGLTVTDCCYIGDSGIDMETATRAGMLAVGVRWGFRDEEELLAHGAQVLVNSPEELIQLVAR